MPQFTEVNSSNLEALALEGSTMHVRFKGGSIYTYTGVSQEIFDQVIMADSVGQSFHQLVKSRPDQYPFQKVA